MSRFNKTAETFCPLCGSDTMQVVKDSRPTTYADHSVVRRRRVCEGCNGKFSTIELPTMLLDDTKLRAEILKRVFDIVYKELMTDAPRLSAHYTMKKGDEEAPEN